MLRLKHWNDRPALLSQPKNLFPLSERSTNNRLLSFVWKASHTFAVTASANNTVETILRQPGFILSGGVSHLNASPALWRPCRIIAA